MAVNARDDALIDLVLNDDTYTLQFDTPNERNEWRDAISAECKAANATTTSIATANTTTTTIKK